MHFHNGVIFLCGKGSLIGFRELNKGSVVLEPEWLKTSQMILDKLHDLRIEADSNVPALRKHINQHLEAWGMFTRTKNFKANKLVFGKREKPRNLNQFMSLIYS